MDGIHLMASAMHAAKAQLDVSAANLANASTNGFQRRLNHATLTSAGLVATSRLDASQGPLKHTGRSFDLAVAGSGGFFVRDAAGSVVATRSGSFARTASGEFADERGRILLGVHGPVIASAEATIDARGVLHADGTEVGRLRLHHGTALEAGFLEAANVDAVHEMVDVLASQRAFETAQKTLSALDEERQKDANDVVRIKS